LARSEPVTHAWKASSGASMVGAFDSAKAYAGRMASPSEKTQKSLSARSRTSGWERRMARRRSLCQRAGHR